MARRKTHEEGRNSCQKNYKIASRKSYSTDGTW